MMNWIISIPAFVKVGIVFLGILFTYRLGVSLGISMLTFSLVLLLWSGMGMWGITYQIQSFIKPENYLLLAVILLLLFFTEALNKTGRIERTVTALEQRFKSRRLLLAGLPAMVGLLPMPGGALFSAPLVDSVDNTGDIPGPLKAVINYWFRHIWEYWWPLYPGVILAMTYSGLNSIQFFLLQMPFSIAAVLAGYFFIMRRVKQRTVNIPSNRLDKRAAVSTLGPIMILVLFAALAPLLLSPAGITGTLANLIGMSAGLIIALIIILWDNNKAFRSSLNIFKSKSTWSMMALVAGILVFSTVLQSPLEKTSDITIVTLMRDEFIDSGIPLLLVMILIPFISGAVTGAAFGFVGASFPIVFALLGPSPVLSVSASATALAYGFGYMGMIISPMHICFVLTNEYFKARLFSSYRYLAIPIIIILAASLLFAALYYYIL